MFNLLAERWLPVVRLRSGPTRIAPWQLTEALGDDPVVALDFPRPDLDAAATEWLIGLMQTCLWDDLSSDKDWHRLWRDPPTPEQLRARMEPFAHAFELFDDDGPAFMQDLRPDELDKRSGVDALFFEVAGQKAAFFVKEAEAPVLCPACAAAALHMLQTYAPAGGAGVRVGLRGGGPLSTVIMADTLWRTVCANILPRNDVGKGCDTEAPLEFGVFPWLTPTRVSSKDSEPVTAGQVHPLHLYWAMPRRMRLVHEQDGRPCACCGGESEVSVTGLRSRHHGNNYEGAWDHPLSAVRHDPNAGPIPVKGKAFSGYRDWLGLVFNETRRVKQGKGKEAVEVTSRTPAPVIARALGSSRRRDVLGRSFRLRACGFAMDNMKPLAWVDEVLPVVLAEDQQGLDAQRLLASQLVNASELARQALYSAVRTAVFDERKDLKAGGGTTLEEADAQFWTRTQSVFDDAMRHGLAALEADLDTEKARRVFLARLQAVTEALYRDLAQTSRLDDTQFRRQAEGWRILQSRIRWPKAHVWQALDILPEREKQPEPQGA